MEPLGTASASILVLTVLVALPQCGESCLVEEGELDLLLVDRETGRPVKPLELRSQDGRPLGPADLRTVNASDW
jgi:hypothetical protein